MLRVAGVVLPLDHPPDAPGRAAAAQLGVPAVRAFRVRRRGYDARGGLVRFVYTLDVEVDDEARLLRAGAKATPDETWRPPAALPRAERPVVIGTGPCGLMAALALAELGLRPIVLERGRKVRQRTQDVWGFWRQRAFQAISNVQFGEGGAGTFSDGKLYSGVKDREHRGRKVMQAFVDAGAPEEILFLSKPHVGTLRLVQVVAGLRRRIEALGGTFRFETQVVDLEIERGRLTGLRLADGTSLAAKQAVLAVGHSARDTFAMLHARGVALRPKPFSIGFRIEHPQALIDRARLGAAAGHPALGAADYKLVHHTAQRSVYSFCMCPGGQVVAATSEEGRVVTNGMSHYSRAERNANAGLVVGITPDDFPSAHPLAGVELQRFWESRAFELGGGTYDAPAQRVGDFLAGRPSTRLDPVVPSYTPGVRPTDLSTALPDYAIAALREAIPALEAQLPGFALPDAVLTAVETRTSSPIRIERGDDLQSPTVAGLYPAGEGAGFAGGILTAGIDGLRVAEAIAQVKP